MNTCSKKVVLKNNRKFFTIKYNDFNCLLEMYALLEVGLKCLDEGCFEQCQFPVIVICR
jgi:hypothetical protein